MNKTRTLVFIFALVAAGGAAVLAKQIMSRPAEVREVIKKDYDTVRVLVAAKELRLGDKVKEGGLRWQQWPADNISKGYIVRKDQPDALKDMVGAIARVPFLRNEPISEEKLIRGNGGVLAALLPKGMVAVSTAIKEESSAGRFILPNDRVDVILTRRLREENSSEQYVADTLFRNIRILAIGQTIESTDNKRTASGNTATLELTPAQAETLALANTMGS
ncbi:MAG: Flp pilus assembly protein CpaB, partial [Pseudomonadota bacterium]